MTVSLFSERPSLGGIELRSGDITIIPTGFGDAAPFQGADISPILLTAGTKYFLGFSDVFHEGVNVASWYRPNGFPVLQPGGDTILDAYYLGVDYSQEFTDLFINGANGSTPVGRAPILRFNGELVSAPPPSVPGQSHVETHASE